VFLLICIGLASPTSAQEKAPIGKSAQQNVFDLLDKNGDKKLQVEEFVAGALSRAAENKRDQFKRWDFDHDGSLSSEEFRKQGNTKPGKFNPEWEFHRRDTSADGVLSFAEFVAEREDEAQSLKQRFAAIDTDQDGKVTLLEYKSRHAAWQRDRQRAEARAWLVVGVVAIDLVVVSYLGWHMTVWLRRRWKTRVRRAAQTATIPDRSNLPSHPPASSDLKEPESLDEFDVI
jgi:Ca2+-binding EF-hand superfamily protein